LVKELFVQKRPISNVAKSILQKRYYNQDLGESSWGQLVNRVVDTVLSKSNEEDKELTREMIKNTYFVPNSPCLVNAGKEKTGLMACYVVDFPDTIEGIFKTKLDFALIARKGGGCGTSLSKIRPEGSPVHGSTHGYAGGGIKFANTISHDAEALTQAGFRNMAIMFTENIRHPDIIKFINAKQEEGVIANANMSVMVDDDFMIAVENNSTYWTEFNGVKYQEYNAKDIFDMIIEGAWRNGEPSFLFKNRIDQSPYTEVGEEIFSTNPCSEQSLPINGVCNLGSIDLSKLVGKDKELDYEKLELIARLGVRFLDSVIYATSYPTKEIEEWSFANAPIGLGIMGYADMLLMQEIPYGSEEALKELEEVMKFLYGVAKEESEILGKEKGIPSKCKNLKEPRRNITLLTIAPTGSISIFAGCSSGIEPIFSEITIRNDKTGTYTFENNLADKPYFRCAVSSNGAQEVTWEEHIKTLASAQKYNDSSTSKTINFPTMTHRETMAKAVMMAWKEGCKGLAMYRNGSRKQEVLSPKLLKKDRCPKCGNDFADMDGKKKCLSCKTENMIEDTIGSYNS
jgi:ribonucleoside-diphosphate reductase alpha chain